MAQTTTTSASRRIVEETRKLYSNVILKPIDEKQLIRPSFKFIQDLVKSLITETKILRDVYTPADFDTTKRNLDRRAKVEFVQKLINFAANNKQPVTNCVASRVIAGLEPNKTNELLQALARIALIKRSANNEKRPRTFVKTLSSSQTNSSLPGSAHSSHSSSRNISADRQRAKQPGDSLQSNQTVGIHTIKIKDEQPTQKLSNKQSNASSSITNKKSSLGETSINSSTRVNSNYQTSSDYNNDNNSIVNTPLERRKSSPKTGSSERQQIIVNITSESDINKNISNLRSNLKSLRTIGSDISRTEELLKENLESQLLIGKETF